MTEEQQLSGRIPEELAGSRLDQALAQMFSNYSRARLQAWIREGKVTVDQRQPRTKDKVIGGEWVEIMACVEPDESWQPEAIPLDIVYEDASLLVVNKAAGMVAHPAVGNREGTLLNALLHHAPKLNKVPRAGIIHRLDKETSGLLVIAKTLAAQKNLVEQLQDRAFEREYQAVVNGELISGGTVDAPIGRHHIDRKRMAVSEAGKEAVTHYRIRERFRGFTHIQVNLETGRTHQIRVHMAHIRYPLVGDPVYGGRLKIPKESSNRLIETLRTFRRQALHAGRLALAHPRHGKWLEWEVPMPGDMQELLTVLREGNRRD